MGADAAGGGPAAPRSRRLAARASTRRWRTFLTIALVLLIGAIVFVPTPPPNGPTTLELLLERWHADGLPAWITFGKIEFAANVVMFVPVGALAYWWRASWWQAVLLGIACTSFIEAVQTLFLPTRVGDPRDLLSNSLGAAIGASLALLLSRRWRRSRARR